jgi:hypothetical protein
MSVKLRFDNIGWFRSLGALLAMSDNSQPAPGQLSGVIRKNTLSDGIFTPNAPFQGS